MAMSTTLVCFLLIAAGEPGTLDSRAEALWRLHYPRYAKQCLPFEDGYVCVPGYDVHHPSSRGVTAAQVQRELTVSFSKDVGGGMSRKLTMRPDEQEIAAYAAVLPGLEVGHYGHIAQVRVDEVIDDEEAILKGIRLIDDDLLDEQIDAERRRIDDVDRGDVDKYMEWKFKHRLAAVDRQKDRDFKQEVRLVGFSTIGVRSRQTWSGANDKGFDVAVVKLENYSERRGKETKQRLVLMPAEELKDIGLTEAQFEALLAERGMDKAGFVELVQEMHAKYRDRTDAERQVFLHLLAIDSPPGRSPPASGTSEHEEKTED